MTNEEYVEKYKLLMGNPAAFKAEIARNPSSALDFIFLNMRQSAAVINGMQKELRNLNSFCQGLAEEVAKKNGDSDIEFDGGLG